jgi:guanine deaminase
VIVEGQLLLPDPARGVRLAHGQLRIHGGVIADIAVFSGVSKGFGTADLGSERSLISPGLVDAHLHLPQFDSIGVDGLTLLDWLHTAIFPAEARWSDADFAGEMAGRVARRLLAAGTTTVAAYATVHHEGTRSAMAALSAAGVRGLVGQVLMDQEAPADLRRPAKQLLKEAAACRVGEFAGIEPIVSPRFAVSCSSELLAGAGALARSTGWAVQTHLSEMIPECERVRELHGAGYVEVYRRAGLLTPRTVLGHGIWLDEGERAMLRESESVIAHCPTANLFLQAGRFDRAGTRAAGVRVALGSDIAGGPDVSMVRVARAMIETVKSRAIARAGRAASAEELPTSADAWHQITAGNADALGMKDAGRLGVGLPADVLVIDPSVGPNAEPNWLSAADPLGKLMYAWDDRWIVRLVR